MECNKMSFMFQHSPPTRGPHTFFIDTVPLIKEVINSVYDVTIYTFQPANFTRCMMEKNIYIYLCLSLSFFLSVCLSLPLCLSLNSLSPSVSLSFSLSLSLSLYIYIYIYLLATNLLH